MSLPFASLACINIYIFFTNVKRSDAASMTSGLPRAVQLSSDSPGMHDGMTVVLITPGRRWKPSYGR